MRRQFPAYYPRADAVIEALWAGCVFVFDANVLLNLYRVSPEARERLLLILERFRDRVWLPHQVALEYHRNRLDRITERTQAYTKLRSHFSGLVPAVRSQIEAASERHPALAESGIVGIAERAAKEATEELDRLQAGEPDLLQRDTVLEAVEDWFDGKVGRPYTGAARSEALARCRERFELMVPPGYRDAGKEGVDRYGDAILWLQLLDFARGDHRPVIFVTNDSKDDWWQVNAMKEKIGPRAELVQEMLDEAGVAFHAYSTKAFAEHASRYLNLDEKPEVTEELRELEEQEEAEDARETEVAAASQELLRRFNFNETITRSFNPASSSILDSILASRDQAIRERWGSGIPNAAQLSKSLASAYGFADRDSLTGALGYLASRNLGQALNYPRELADQPRSRRQAQPEPEPQEAGTEEQEVEGEGGSQPSSSETEPE